MQNTYRKKLLDLLRTIQLFGVKTMQHIAKPELYSGSRLEKINNENDFYAYISRLSPPEDNLSIYNVLFPIMINCLNHKGKKQIWLISLI